jgi:hypothetical protein
VSAPCVMKEIVCCMIVGFQLGAHFMFYDYMYFIGHLFPSLTSIYRDHQSFLGKSLLRCFAVFQDAGNNNVLQATDTKNNQLPTFCYVRARAT